MWTIVRPCPPIFEEEARTEDELLTEAMTNFVAWYRRVSPERLGAAVDLLGDLRDVLPSFESLSLIATGEDARALEAVFKRPHKRSRYRLGQLSDGQRALIALYCLLRFCDGGAARASLFVDEPDNYISLREKYSRGWWRSVRGSSVHGKRLSKEAPIPMVMGFRFRGIGNGQMVLRQRG